MNAVFASIMGAFVFGALAFAGGSALGEQAQRAALVAWARAEGSGLHQAHVERLAAAIVAAAYRYEVPAALLASIAYHESRWNPAAVNGTHCGPFQQKVMYSARWSDRGYAGQADAPRLTCDQLCTDVEQAARIAARKIRTYSRETGSFRVALCMYARGATGGADCIDGGAYADSELALAREIDAFMRRS